jgi:ATP-binding cassette subfamily B protein
MALKVRRRGTANGSVRSQTRQVPFLADFEPPPPAARYGPPTATVHPDQSKGWFRRLVPVVASHKWVLAGSLLASVSALGVRLAIPQVVGMAIDRGLVQRTSPISTYLWGLAALGVAQAFLGYTSRFGMQRLTADIEYDLRAVMLQHLSRLSFSFYDKAQTGQLVSRANSDIRSVQMFLAFAPNMSVTVLSFAAALVLMFQMHVLLTLATIAAMPFIYVIGTIMRTTLFPISYMVMARSADIATIVEENVTGTRIVKAFVAEKAQLGLLERAARRLRFASVKQVDNQARFAPLMQNIPRLSLAVLLAYGGWLVIHDKLSFGSFVAFNSYVVLLQMPFMMLGFLMMMAQRASASAQRILEVLDTPPEIYDRPGAVDLVTSKGDVRLESVTFGYASNPPVLRGLDLHLRPGETAALVGRTGCGKSTIARLIPRFYDVQEGRVLVDGKDVRDLTLASLRSHIGLVLDEPFLFSESIRDNIAFGRPDATDGQIAAAAKAAGADDFITAMAEGYETVIGERGYTLSGGQRQRIAIARTLLVNPKILILDDATSSIDAQREYEIHDALRTLMRGRTTLIIAHRLSTISLAERVLLMDDGRIIADGTHAQLMRDVPLYSEVLAHAEEEWQAAHHPEPAEAPDLPPRMRAMMRMMSQADGAGMPPGAGPGMPPGAMPGGGVPQ